MFDERVNKLEQELMEYKQYARKFYETQREVNTSHKTKVDDLFKKHLAVETELDQKMTEKEGQTIWANFQKYAIYDDLKDLYQRCVPAISSFEDKL